MKKEYYRYRALNFDLKERALVDNFGVSNTASAYKKIKSYLTHRHFIHRQYSGYRSASALTDADTLFVIFGLYDTYEWLFACVRRFDMTNIGVHYDVHDEVVSLKEKKVS
jgi:virulence-associated protein VapD